MLGKPDPVKAGTAASYLFALAMAITLGVNSVDVKINYSTPDGLTAEAELKEPSTHVLILTIFPMALALGVKIPPELIAKFIGVKSVQNDKEDV